MVTLHTATLGTAIIWLIGSLAKSVPVPDHPYKGQPAHAFWSSAVGQTAIDKIDPVVRGKFKILASEKVVTAGSCFAQHISRRLAASGINLFVTEPPHPSMNPAVSAAYGYGVYSARYGNIYNPRQLLQLLQRAMGVFVPQESAWENSGSFFDPFRASVHPGGFASLLELDLDRAQHLNSAIRAFAEMDVFIFTLGLTECWASTGDGAVFSSCPGVVAGTFNPQLHQFINLDVNEVVSDLDAFIDLARNINPDFKMILTVAPVALAATALDQHVLSATTYSKSVLRVAAAMVEAAAPDRIAYFPSYEIITGAPSRGRYFEDDLRNVTDEAVDRVMSLFFKHYVDQESGRINVAEVATDEVRDLKRLMDIDCEEGMLDI